MASYAACGNSTGPSMTLTHSTVVAVADDGTSPVGTNEWNADHVVSGTSGQVQYNDSGVLTGMNVYRESASETAHRNGTTAQAQYVYNTYTDASNYERGVFDWTTTANTLTIGTQAGGTGTARSVALVSAVTNSPIGVGGSTSSFPAIRRDGAVLGVVLADNSAYT